MAQKFWKRGELAKLSTITGIRPTALSDYFHRRISISVRRATMLQSSIKQITGKDVPFMELVLSKQSKHPCFF